MEIYRYIYVYSSSASFMAFVEDCTCISEKSRLEEGFALKLNWILLYKTFGKSVEFKQNLFSGVYM